MHRSHKVRPPPQNAHCFSGVIPRGRCFVALFSRLSTRGRSNRSSSIRIYSCCCMGNCNDSLSDRTTDYYTVEGSFVVKPAWCEVLRLVHLPRHIFCKSTSHPIWQRRIACAWETYVSPEVRFCDLTKLECLKTCVFFLYMKLADTLQRCYQCGEYIY